MGSSADLSKAEVGDFWSWLILSHIQVFIWGLLKSLTYICLLALVYLIVTVLDLLSPVWHRAHLWNQSQDQFRCKDSKNISCCFLAFFFFKCLYLKGRRKKQSNIFCLLVHSSNGCCMVRLKQLEARRQELPRSPTWVAKAQTLGHLSVISKELYWK